MESSARTAAPFLLWRSRGQIGALRVPHVTEIMRRLPIERLVGAPPFVMGVSVVREHPTPIIDVGLLIEGASGAADRLVIVRINEERCVALAVDEVIGIRDLESTLMMELPALLRQDESHIERIAALDGQLLVILESAHVVPDAVWSEIEGRKE